MTVSKPGRHTLAAAMLAISSTLAVPAFAQEDSSLDPSGGSSAIASRHGQRPSKKKKEEVPAAPARYPNATRKAPELRATAKNVEPLNAMLELYNGGKLPEARAAADAIIANPASNAYDKAFAARLAGAAAAQGNDDAAALGYVQQAIDADALGNDEHLDAMLFKAQLQMRAKDYAAALASADGFMAASGATPPDALMIRGNALYRLGRYADAAVALKQAVAADPSHADWQALLADALTRSGNVAEAQKVADTALADPGNAAARYNLVQALIDGGQVDKAVAMLEKMRAAQQLDENGYSQLFTAYANTRGKEKETAAVIEEGMAKGLLKADYNTEIALAQSYYFSDQVAKAIATYQKASALAKDGEVDLNLARIYLNEQRISDAKAAAQKALSRGVKNPADAKKILALPGK